MHIDGFFKRFLEIRVREICIETGCICPNWVDEEKAYELYLHDKKNGSNFCEEYERGKCRPDGIISVTNGKDFNFRIECKSANWKFPDPDCNCNYAAAREIFEKEFKELFKEADEHIQSP